MKTHLSFLLAVPLLLLTSGCFTPGASPDVTFYQLRPSPVQPKPMATFDDILVIGPIELSPYINNSRLVYRPTTHQVAYRELHRWAEPLEQNLANILAQDISAYLDSQTTIAYTPRVALREGMHSLRIRIHRFDIDEDGKAVVEISAVHLEGTEAVRNPILRLNLTGRPEGTGPEAEVEALNKLVHEVGLALSRELAKGME